MVRIGDNIDGYCVLAFLGRGGMGAVYKVTKNGEEYAMKICTSDDADDIKRFNREVRLMGGFNHPSVIKLINYNLVNTPPYFIMPIYQCSLKSILESDTAGPTDEKKLDWAIQIAKAIKVVHDADEIHRDIKPSNILMNDSDIVLTDFGLGRFVNRDSTTITGSEDHFIGTWGYMAPEIYIDGNAKVADKRCDIYSFGKLLYALFSGNTNVEYINENDVDSNILHIIQKCIKVTLENRYGNIDEVINALIIHQRFQKMGFSLKELIDGHHLGVNDQTYINKITDYMLGLEGFDQFLSDARFLKESDYLLIKRYKKEQLNQWARIPINTFEKNGCDLYIRFEDWDLVAKYLQRFFADVDSTTQTDILDFLLTHSLVYNRYPAMQVWLDMVNGLPDSQFRGLSVFLNSRKVDIEELLSRIGKTPSARLKMIMQ
jgi:serine/threonine protein kinase